MRKSSADELQNPTWIQVSVSEVYQASWKYYGQMLAVNGQVLDVSEYPPGSDISNLIADGDNCSEKVITNQLNHEGYKTKKDNFFNTNEIRGILHNPAYKGLFVLI